MHRLKLEEPDVGRQGPYLLEAAHLLGVQEIAGSQKGHDCPFEVSANALSPEERGQDGRCPIQSELPIFFCLYFRSKPGSQMLDAEVLQHV